MSKDELIALFEKEKILTQFYFVKNGLFKDEFDIHKLIFLTRDLIKDEIIRQIEFQNKWEYTGLTNE